MVAAAVSGVLVAITLGGLMVYYTIKFPHPASVNTSPDSPTIRILARDGLLIARRGTNSEYMPLAFLPKHVQAAVVAIEDRRFFEHFGADPNGLARAMFRNLRAGRFVQGGSTLTQQLAKNLFLSSDRTIARKVEELALAFWLELRLSKAEILEIYLNRVYFGAGAYGIESASQRYFDKSARELTLAEGALLAGLLKAPSRYSPSSRPEQAVARSRLVLASMLDAGFITPAEKRHAMTQRMIFATKRRQRDKDGSGYVVDYVLERMPQFIREDYGDVIVDTTLDLDLQRAAWSYVRDGLRKYGEPNGASQAALIVLDNDGGIRAMVGGKDYRASQFNRAVMAKRQPGSAFKPIVYLAGIEGGLRPDSAARDFPVRLGDWSPENNNGKYSGDVTLRDALARSINTVAVQVLQYAGVDQIIRTSRRLGIESTLRADASLALGTSEVSLIELTSAYSTFANGGENNRPHIVRRIRSRSGEILFARTRVQNPLVGERESIGAINDMLNAAVVYGTGKRAAIARHPVAGKTGTTQDNRDAWFVGYTSQLTAGVWIGNDDGRPMEKVSGGGLPAHIWQQVMSQAHSNRRPLALPGTTVQRSQDSGPVRVVETRERLPWLTPPKLNVAGQQISRSSQKSNDGQRQSRPQHPTERIDEAFFSRILGNAAPHQGG